MKLMKERHSVRQYENKVIASDVREQLNNLVAECNKESGLHIQILYDEPQCFNSMMAHYGKFSGVANYIAMVGPKSPQLDEKCGYYGERLVLKAQELGLNTCWVAMTHGKSKAVLSKGEKQAILISLGYGTTSGVEHKGKTAADVSNAAKESPDWFHQGVEAALLAPTAMNQQKFFLTHDPSTDTAEAKIAGFGFYSKIDLGIVKYHFEAASGHKLK